MEKNILRLYYTKAIFVAAIALTLCGVVAALVKIASVWVIGGLVALYYLYSAFSLYRDSCRGNVVSVYAACVETLNTKRRLGTNYKKSTVYRFLTLAENEEDEATFHIMSTSLTEFRPGATYCLLFKKMASGEFSERNLISYQIVPPNVVSYNIANGQKESGYNAETAQQANLFDEEDEPILQESQPKESSYQVAENQVGEGCPAGGDEEGKDE